MDLLTEALRRLRSTLAEAQRRHIPDANAAALATADTAAIPSVRTAYIMLGEACELVFFTHRDSGKARQLLVNPNAGIMFYWPELATQIEIDAEVTEPNENVAQECWRRRPHESQLAAWVSRQSVPTNERRLSPSRLEQQRQAFDFRPVPLPADWQAFQLMPRRIEFWEGGWRRLQTRTAYIRQSDGTWSRERYEP